MEILLLLSLSLLDVLFDVFIFLFTVCLEVEFLIVVTFVVFLVFLIGFFILVMSEFRIFFLVLFLLSVYLLRSDNLSFGLVFFVEVILFLIFVILSDLEFIIFFLYKFINMFLFELLGSWLFFLDVELILEKFISFFNVLLFFVIELVVLIFLIFLLVYNDNIDFFLLEFFFCIFFLGNLNF